MSMVTGLLFGESAVAVDLAPDVAMATMTGAEFEAFHRATVKSLRAYVVRVLGRATQADDIVQEAYLRFLRSRMAGDSLDRRRAYLFRVATNLIVDDWRRRRLEQPAAEAVEPVRMDPDVSLKIDMARAFARLRPDERAMMWLAYVEGADHREIARALGVSRLSVRVLLFRTRRKLARYLANPGAGDGGASC
jgi:RNA polymerase sigma-70 factor (ECF subfamily)